MPEDGGVAFDGDYLITLGEKRLSVPGRRP